MPASIRLASGPAAPATWLARICERGSNLQALLLVRHAEIDNAQGRRFVGLRDLPLTPTGEAQAKALGEYLGERMGGIPFAALAASPLRRALATAAALGAAGAPAASVLPDLREIDFGAWEGRMAEDVAREEPEAYARWRAVDPGFAFPGGEALADAARRMTLALASLWPAEGGTAVAVAHGGVLRLGLCGLLGLPWTAAAKLRLDFTGVTRLERHEGGGDGRLVLAGLNDTAHLDPVREALR